MYRPLIIAAALLTLAGAPAIAATSHAAPTQTTQTSAKIVRTVSAKPAGKVAQAKTETRKGATSHRSFAKLVRHGHASKTASKTREAVEGGGLIQTAASVLPHSLSLRGRPSPSEAGLAVLRATV